MPHAAKKTRAHKNARGSNKAASKRSAAKTNAGAKRSGRRVTYSVAMSLDGYIAGPNGEYDWIVMDPDIDFAEIFSQFDTFLMGRRTFAITAAAGKGGSSPGVKSVVFSKTLQQSDYSHVTIVSDNAAAAVKELKAQPGKDIWLFGGGELFRSLLDGGVVDRVGVAVMPVLVGGGVPFLPAPATRTKLKLVKHKLYPRTGVVSLEYEVI